MITRWTSADFVAATACENGSLLRLFSHTHVDPHLVPAELYHLVVDANLKYAAPDVTLDRIAETLGIEREET